MSSPEARILKAGMTTKYSHSDLVFYSQNEGRYGSMATVELVGMYKIPLNTYGVYDTKFCLPNL